jgi:hypothetical protein
MAGGEDEAWDFFFSAYCCINLQTPPASINQAKALVTSSDDVSLTTNTRTILNIYTECPRRNVPDFGRVFLVLKYTDITQNTYVKSWTVTEIMAWEKCGLLWDYTHCTCQLTVLSVSSPWVWCHVTPTQFTLTVNCICTSFRVTSALGLHVSCIVHGTLRTTMTRVRVFFLVQFNGFMSLTR